MRYVILNRTGETSLFKRGLHELLKSEGEKLVLGYGYLSPGLIVGSGSTFIENLDGWANSGSKEIIIIGNNEKDYSEYIQVATYLSNRYKDKEIKVKVIIKDENSSGKRQYHKKLAIKFTDFKGKIRPSIALMGSSNLSRATYIDMDYSQEVDILLWNRFILGYNEENNEYDKEKEVAMLKKIGKDDAYISRYSCLLGSIENSVGIDLGLELQLEDIIYEIENYKDCRFSLKYVNENNYYNISVEELEYIINSGESDQYYDKESKTYKDVLDQELKMKVIKDSLLCFYRYAQYNLDNKNNRHYFNSQYNSFKDLINKPTKEAIVEAFEDRTSHYKYFKDQTFRNTIDGKEIYEILMEVLSCVEEAR